MMNEIVDRMSILNGKEGESILKTAISTVPRERKASEGIKSDCRVEQPHLDAPSPEETKSTTFRCSES